MMSRNSQIGSRAHVAVDASVFRSIRSLLPPWLCIACCVVGVMTMVMASGCGISVTQSFPNQLVGTEGQRFTVEELEAIADDPDLNDDEKREAFRDLGIQDEKLIDALLSL